MSPTGYEIRSAPDESRRHPDITRYSEYGGHARVEQFEYTYGVDTRNSLIDSPQGMLSYTLHVMITIPQHIILFSGAHPKRHANPSKDSPSLP